MDNATFLALPQDFSRIPTLGLFPNEERYEPHPNGRRRMLGAVSSRGEREPWQPSQPSR